MTKAEIQKAKETTALRFVFSYTPEIEAMGITALELSNRSLHGLQHAGIATIGEVLSRWGTLGKIRNLGVGSVKEIHASVFAFMYEHGRVALQGLA